MKAQTPIFQWAKSMGGVGADEGLGIKCDSFGNVYTTGYFVVNADFDPGAVIRYQTASGSSGAPDIFVSKLDRNGSYVWAKAMGGAYADKGTAIDVDGQGNIYTTGYFTDQADFDPGSAQFNLTTSNSSTWNVFISKLDSLGNFVWAKKIGGGSLQYFEGNSIKVDGQGNVFVTGHFFGSGDFDPGPGTYTLSSNGTKDIFVVKLDSSGIFQWARSIGGSSDDDGFSIGLDVSGDVVVSGTFTGNVDFDPGPSTFYLNANVAADAFVLRLNSAGNLVWAVNFGGSNGIRNSSLAIDRLGNICTVGHFQSSVDFDPGVGVNNLTSVGLWDAYVLKLYSNGPFAWVRSFRGTNDEKVFAVAIDTANNVITTGLFQGIADFDPGSGTHNLSNLSSSGAAFLSALDANGNFVYAKSLDPYSGGYALGMALSTDPLNNLYSTGVFSGSADFDIDTSVYDLYSAGSNDIYVHKTGQCSESTSFVALSSCGSMISPSGNQIWSLSGTYFDTIRNFSGCDSFITVNLNIHSNTSSIMSVAACDSHVSPSGNYIWSNSGMYFDTIPNAVGCDSFVTINLTINNNSATTVSYTGCQSFQSPSGNFTWTSSGVYTDTLANSVGCDSVITVNLTIDSVNTSVIDLGIQLVAVASGVNYQWVDCNNNYAYISGATSQSFTATSNGSYAVIVTQNSCSDTSNCFTINTIGLTRNSFGDIVRIYPNPTSKNLVIDLGKSFSKVSIEVRNLQGQIVSATDYSSTNKISFDIDGPNGFYFLEIAIDDENRAMFSVIKR